MRIVIDTGVFFHAAALRALASQPHEIIVPAVVFAERARQRAKLGEEPSVLLDRLEEQHMRLEPFGPAEAIRYVPRITDDRTWEKLARDAMIAGHVGPGDVLWTANRKDFEAIGVPPEQIVDVP